MLKHERSVAGPYGYMMNILRDSYVVEVRAWVPIDSNTINSGIRKAYFRREFHSPEFAEEFCNDLPEHSSIDYFTDVYLFEEFHPVHD